MIYLLWVPALYIKIKKNQPEKHIRKNKVIYFQQWELDHAKDGCVLMNRLEEENIV